MLGNVVTGVSVLAPAGMLVDLSRDLGVSIRDAGLLITFGAVVLCVGSPLTAWLTSRIDRRTLLGATLAVLALGNLASAFAPEYYSLLVIRLVMLAVGALFTPQAAGTAALMVPPEKRGSTMSYVFLGWSIAAAIGLPLVAYMSSHFGWRAAFGGISLVATIGVALLVWRLPSGLIGAPVDLKTWIDLAKNPLIVLLLLITVLQTAGQFVVFTFMGPLLMRLADAGPELVALTFAMYGITGFIGNVIATRIVDSWGSYRTSLIAMVSMLIGVTLWSVGAGWVPAMATGVVFWGLGFASTNSMQQVRLAGAAPALASASVSLNTSSLYIGQAIGSAIGGMLFVRDLLVGMGYVAVAFVALGVGVVILTRRG